MSMFSFPAEHDAEMMKKTYETMSDWMGKGPAASPLFLQPVGMAAASAAIGLGVASHMAGFMMGLYQGMMTHAHDGHPHAGHAGDAPFAGTVATSGAGAVAAMAPAVKDKPARRAPRAARPASPATMTAVARLQSEARAAAEAVTERAPAASGSGRATEASAIEPEDFRRPVEIERPQAPDDLKLIGGIGPKLEQVLNGLGIWTFGQIAAWTPNEVAWVDDYLQFKGRIGRDNWIGQAAALARGGAEEYRKVFGRMPNE